MDGCRDPGKSPNQKLGFGIVLESQGFGQLAINRLITSNRVSCEITCCQRRSPETVREGRWLGPAFPLFASNFRAPRSFGFTEMGAGVGFSRLEILAISYSFGQVCVSCSSSRSISSL